MLRVKNGMNYDLTEILLIDEPHHTIVDVTHSEHLLLQRGD
jgi:hypothetical protein